MHVRRSCTADGYTSFSTLPESDCVDAENVRALTFRAGEMALSERKGVRLAACLHEEPVKQLGLINTKEVFTVYALYSAFHKYISLDSHTAANQTAAHQVSRTKFHC